MSLRSEFGSLGKMGGDSSPLKGGSSARPCLDGGCKLKQRFTHPR